MKDYIAVVVYETIPGDSTEKSITFEPCRVRAEDETQAGSIAEIAVKEKVKQQNRAIDTVVFKGVIVKAYESMELYQAHDAKKKYFIVQRLDDGEWKNFSCRYVYTPLKGVLAQYAAFRMLHPRSCFRIARGTLKSGGFDFR